MFGEGLVILSEAIGPDLQIFGASEYNLLAIDRHELNVCNLVPVDVITFDTVSGHHNL